MLSQEELKRYSRHIILSEIGKKGQEKLKNAKVLVIGAGGLGCPVLQYLTAAGVGTIGIVEFDKVNISNLQRQILFTHNDIGKNKAQAAKERLSLQNSFVTFNIYETFLTKDNALEIIQNYDIVVDGSDNFATRYLTNDACVIANKPLVFGAIFKFDGQVSVFNYQAGPTYRCLFPEPPEPNSVPNCSDIGVLGVLPGIIGTLQANEALKIILEIGEVLSGKFFTFDALQMQSFAFEFEKNKSLEITELIDYEIFCGTSLQNTSEIEEEISFETLQNLSKKEFLLVDLRPKSEHEEHNIGGINIPLEIFSVKYKSLPTEKNIVLYCEYGQRSLKALQFLKQEGFTQVAHLKGGLSIIEE